jgi:hypothetical protein
MATDASGANANANIILGTVTISSPITPQTPTAAPEPGTLLMAGTALIALGVVLKRNRQQR